MSKIEKGEGIKVQTNDQEIYLNDSKFEVKDVVLPIKRVEAFQNSRNAIGYSDVGDSQEDNSATLVACTTTFTSLMALSVFLF